MRILTRYILLELGKVFLLATLALTGTMLIVGVVREALGQSLPPAELARLIPYVIPDALRIALPVALLLATTTVYARMAGSNEVVAIKSLGIFPMAVLWPTLAAAFLLSLVTVWLNDVAVSWGRDGVRRVVMDAGEEIAYSMLRTQGHLSRRDFTIIVKRMDGRRLIRPILILKGRGGTSEIHFMAEEARLRSDRRRNVLRITLINTDVEGLVKVRLPGEQTHEVSLEDIAEIDDSSRPPSWLPLRSIPDQIHEQRADIERYEQELAVRAAHQMVSGDFEGMVSPEWNSRQRNLDGKRVRLCRLQTEPYRRWSAGFSCLCFVFVGGPMAVRLRNRDFLTSFFLCFAPILIVYYPALAYTVDAAKSGAVPPIAVWAGNAALIGWGAWLLRRVIRY
ncbi:MAG: LptF/LptG family permease [Planctomycetota bacterium]|jgi:lipopolysaccharide export system permease protein